MRPVALLRRGVAAACVLVAPVAASAVTPVTVTPVGISAGALSYTQNFDGALDFGTTATTSSRLPAGWQIDETGANTAGNDDLYITANNNTGSTHSFGSTVNGVVDLALGTLTSNNGAAQVIGAFFVNEAARAIQSISLSYVGEQWRLGGAATDQLDFEYSFDATGLTNGTWTALDALDFVSLQNGAGSGSASAALDGNAAANRSALSSTLATNIASGGTFAVRWRDSLVTASNHALAVDDFALTATLESVAPAVPEPATWAMMVLGFGIVGSAARRRRGLRGVQA